MLETYKKSWSILFKNISIFLPTIVEFIIIYLLFLLTFYFANLTLSKQPIDQLSSLIETVKATYPAITIFFIINFIITAFTKSLRLGYIKQAISNNKISIMKDLKSGINNFKSVLLTKVLIFLLYSVTISLLTTLLVIVSILLQFANFTKNNALELNGYFFIFFIILAVIIIALSTLNTYPAIFLKGLKGKKAFSYSYNLFKSNKKELIKTVIALIITIALFSLISYLLSLIFSGNTHGIINLLLAVILTTWPDTYIFFKFKDLKSPKS